MTICLMLASKDKKQFDEYLQEVRTKHKNKLRYQKRRQQEREADQELKDYEDRKAER